MEEIGLLLYRRDHFPHRGDAVVSEVPSSDRDLPLAGVPVPQEEIGAGALAGAGMAHQNDRLVRVDGEGNIMEDQFLILPFPVGEGHVVEDDPAVARRRGLSALVLDGRLKGQHVLDAVGGGEHQAQFLGDGRQFVHRSENDGGEHDGDGVHRHRDAPAGDEHGCRRHDHRGEQPRNDMAHHHFGSFDGPIGILGVVKLLHAGPDLVPEPPFAAERDDLPKALHAFHEGSVALRQVLPDRRAYLLRPFSDRIGDRHQQQRREEHEQHHDRADLPQHGRDDERDRKGDEKRAECMRQKQLQHFDIGDDGLPQLSGLFPERIGGRHFADLLIEVEPEVPDDLERHVVGEIHLAKVGQRPKQDADDQNGDEPSAAIAQGPAEGQAHDVGRDARRRDDGPLFEERRKDGGRHLAPVRPNAF